VHPTECVGARFRAAQQRDFAPLSAIYTTGETMTTDGNVKAIQEEKELETVFSTTDEAEAIVVQGLLESNEIDSLLANLEAPQDVLPGVGGVAIRVRSSDAAEARELIESQRNAPPAPEESTEGAA
jgi:hypothetical protein